MFSVVALALAGCVSDASEPDDHADTADERTLTPAWNPGHGPFCYYNCGPFGGAISATPSALTLPANTRGSTTLHWTWNETPSSPVSEYACVYVIVNGASTMSVVDCEHPGNTYAVSIPWIVAPNQYSFVVALSNLGRAPTVPTGSLLVLSSTAVTTTVQ